jgi:hypothetical protein
MGMLGVFRVIDWHSEVGRSFPKINSHHTLKVRVEKQEKSLYTSQGTAHTMRPLFVP